VSRRRGDLGGRGDLAHLQFAALGQIGIVETTREGFQGRLVLDGLGNSHGFLHDGRAHLSLDGVSVLAVETTGKAVLVLLGGEPGEETHVAGGVDFIVGGGDAACEAGEQEKQSSSVDTRHHHHDIERGERDSFLLW
jgi:hypothetical protein